MNAHWSLGGAACPIVEFHHIRTEPGAAAARLLALEDEFRSDRGGAGMASLGAFAVAGHPDRLLLMKGYASPADRRDAWSAFHSSALWQRHRREATGLVRSVETVLTRSISPEAGLGLLRPDEGLTAVVAEMRDPCAIGDYHLWLRLLLRKAGTPALASFATLERVNDVPAVPVVRDRSHHIVLIRHGSPAPVLPPELRAMLRFGPQSLTLEPAMAPVW